MQPQRKAELILRNRWRLTIPGFAARVSRGRWKPYPWLDWLLKRVQAAVLKGGARLIINAPPRHGKSESLSHWLPAWYLEWHPDRRVILASYGDTFASHWGAKVRDEFERDDAELWLTVRQDQRASADWITQDGGGMRTAGVGGAITGHGADLIIVDDPHKNWEEAMSSVYRRKVTDWFASTLYTRAEPGASIVIVQTRWHEHDLTGYLLEAQPDVWTHYSLPALAEGSDPIGRDYGQALCPERYTASDLAVISRRLGPHLFAGLYQQRPAPSEGAIIRPEWIKRWAQPPSRPDRWLQSWDCTFRPDGTSYVVGQVWARSSGLFYLVDQFRDRVDFPATIRAISDMSAKWPLSASEILVEQAANGHAVIQVLQDQVRGITPVQPIGSKEARLVAVSGLFADGAVLVPPSDGDYAKPWAEALVQELVTFPAAANDDQVDAMTQALYHMRDQLDIATLVVPSAGLRDNVWRSL